MDKNQRPCHTLNSKKPEKFEIQGKIFANRVVLQDLDEEYCIYLTVV